MKHIRHIRDFLVKIYGIHTHNRNLCGSSHLRECKCLTTEIKSSALGQEYLATINQ